MIQQITSKIMLGGIEKYAKSLQYEKKDVQIRVTSGLEGEINYEICVKWQPKEVVSFKDILNKKIDILGYEGLATPFLNKSIQLYEKEFKEHLKDGISIFLFNRNDNVWLAVFNGTKNVKLLTLSEHFEHLGL